MYPLFAIRLEVNNRDALRMHCSNAFWKKLCTLKNTFKVRKILTNLTNFEQSLQNKKSHLTAGNLHYVSSLLKACDFIKKFLSPTTFPTKKHNFPVANGIVSSTYLAEFE